MPRTTDDPKASPIALKAFHALIFWSFTAATLAASTLELSQLKAAWSRPLHHGDPPAPMAIAGVSLSLVGALVIAARLFRRRSAPLWSSGLILFGGALAVFSLYTWTPRFRTAPAANTALLNATVALQKKMVGVLSEKKTVPHDLREWDRAFAEVTEDVPSVVRNRAFLRVPYRLERVGAPDGLPEVLRPGTVGLYVSDDGASFSLRPVGFAADGGPWPLEDPDGEPLTLRGTYNPEGFAEPASPPTGQELQPLIRP